MAKKNNNNKTLLLAAAFILLIVIAYFATADKGQKTTSDKSESKEKVFFTVDSASVDKIEIATKKGNITLAKDGGEWKQTAPINYKVQPTFVPLMVADLKNFKVDSKVSSNPEKKDNYGFNDSSRTVVTIYEKGNKKGTLEIGSNAPGSNFVFMKKPDDNNVYLVDGIIRSNIVKEDLSEWRDKQIISIPVAEINSIDITMPSESFKITKDSVSKFYIGKDTIPSTVITGYLNLLSNMNTQGFYDKPLDPAAKVTSSLKVDRSGGKVSEISFLKLDSNPGKYLIRTNFTPQIFEIDDALYTNMIKTKASFLMTGDKTNTNGTVNNKTLK